MKEIFPKELVLAILDLDEKMRTEVNISDYTVGDVLSIKYEDRKWRSV